MTQTQQIASTIRDQIQAIDPRALWAWGVKPKSYYSLSENEDRLGGLQFDPSNCPHVKQGRVTIELNGLDLYDITVYRWGRKKSKFQLDPNKTSYDRVLKEVETVEGAYAEDLVPILDRILG